MLKNVLKFTGITLLGGVTFVALFIFFSFINMKEMMAKENVEYSLQAMR